MRPVFLVVPVLVALVSGAQRRTPCDLVIRNVGLFDGQHARGIVDIAIRNDTIVQIAHSITTCVDHNAIDGAGKFVVPGLINSHVHLWEKKDLKAALDIGVFAVIDLHSSEGPDQMLRGLRDSSLYASYFSSGIAATSPKGHPTELFPIETINDSVTPSQFVEHRISKGADFIKIVSNNPNLDSLWRSELSLNYRQIGEIVDAARRRHKQVLVHISHVDEAVRIAELGVDGFAHLWSYNRVSLRRATETTEESRNIHHSNSSDPTESVADYRPKAHGEARLPTHIVTHDSGVPGNQAGSRRRHTNCRWDRPSQLGDKLSRRSLRRARYLFKSRIVESRGAQDDDRHTLRYFSSRWDWNDQRGHQSQFPPIERRSSEKSVRTPGYCRYLAQRQAHSLTTTASWVRTTDPQKAPN